MKTVMTKDGKVSVPSIIDPMLLAGTHTRADIIAAVRSARPDYKDPAAPISDRFKALVIAGKNPGLVEGERKPRAKGVPAGPTVRTIKQQMAKIDERAARVSEEVAAGFKWKDEFMAEVAKRPRAKHVWA